MKHLPFAFCMLALAAAIAAIWRPEYVWQCSLTAVVLIIAAAALVSGKQVKK